MKLRGWIVATALVLGAAGVSEAQFDVDPAPSKRSAGEGKLQFSGFIGSLSQDQSLGTSSNIYQSVSGEATDIDFGKLFGFRASWAFTRNITAEFNFTTGSNTYGFVVDDDEIGTVVLEDQLDADQLNFGGNIVFEIPLGDFVPYATGGVGILRTSPSGSIEGVEDISATDFNFGGGLKYWFSTWVGARVDARYHTANDGLSFADATDSPTTKGFEFTVGASFRFF